MRKTVTSLFISLDGVVEAADPLTRLGLGLASVTSLGSGALQVTYTPAPS